MRRFLALSVLLVAAAGLSGCITSETLIKLNADGSGTVEQTMLVNAKTLEMIPQMMAGMMGGDVQMTPSEGGGSSPLDMFDEEKLRADAGSLGDGVRFVSSEKITRGDMQGARVIYAFDNINTLSIEQDPQSSMLGDLGPGPGGDGDRDTFGFKLTRQAGGNALLTVVFDEPQASQDAMPPADAAAPDDMPDGMDAMMAQMFDGFRVAVDVEVNGPIVRTSSPFAQGSRVTVLEMDLGILLKDPASLARLQQLSPGAGVSEMLPLLRDIQGIKVNQSPLTIEFTGR